MDVSHERLVGEVAAAAGRHSAAVTAEEQARTKRNAAMLRARRAEKPVSYRTLMAATGLTRTGVYKALEDAAGGSLRDSTPDDPVG